MFYLNYQSTPNNNNINIGEKDSSYFKWPPQLEGFLLWQRILKIKQNILPKLKNFLFSY